MSSRMVVGQEEPVTGSWASESLPMSVRRQLLERELAKLGFRRADAGRQGAEAGTVQQQQQPSERPQADATDSAGARAE